MIHLHRCLFTKLIIRHVFIPCQAAGCKIALTQFGDHMHFSGFKTLPIWNPCACAGGVWYITFLNQLSNVSQYAVSWSTYRYRAQLQPLMCGCCSYGGMPCENIGTNKPQVIDLSCAQYHNSTRNLETFSRSHCNLNSPSLLPFPNYKLTITS